MNTKLKKSMGDLDVETKRWCRRVRQCGYNLVSMYECQWKEMVSTNEIIKKHVSTYSMSDPITSRAALYGGRVEPVCLYARGDDTHPIRYVDIVSQCICLYNTNQS